MRGAWSSMVVALVACAGCAHGAVVSVSGYASLSPTGSTAVLSPGTGGVFATTLTPFSATADNLEISGTVRARSTIRDLGGGMIEQAMDLAWQELRVVTCATHEISFTINLSQTFAIAPQFVGNQATFNSFASYTNVQFAGVGQTAGWARTRSDGGAVSDVTIARTRTSTTTGTTLFDGLSGFGASQMGLASLYTMNMALSFTLTPNGHLMTLTDTGGPTIATLVMVPMTSAAWAGAVGLAMVGVVAVKRRRAMVG